MLTTTVDGLWVLQVLSGIETLAPELALRPYLPSAEDSRMALAHPIARELQAAGAITEDGTLDQTLREWLTVVSRRDVSLLVHAMTPTQGADGGAERILLARFAHWWVTLERSGIMVRLSGVGTTTHENTADILINSQIERLCGPMQPASFRPVTVDVAELLARVHDRASLRAHLLDQRLDADQIDTLTIATDTGRSAQASIVAIQSGVTGAPQRAHIESGAVTVIDTPRGRLISEHVTQADKTWMILSPGSPGNIAAAVHAMMRRLPAKGEWHSFRKVV